MAWLFCFFLLADFTKTVFRPPGRYFFARFRRSAPPAHRPGPTAPTRWPSGPPHRSGHTSVRCLRPFFLLRLLQGNCIAVFPSLFCASLSSCRSFSSRSQLTVSQNDAIFFLKSASDIRMAVRGLAPGTPASAVWLLFLSKYSSLPSAAACFRCFPDQYFAVLAGKDRFLTRLHAIPSQTVPRPGVSGRKR